MSVQTVKEQLLYEVGDPGNYLSPDATVSFLTLRVEAAGAEALERRIRAGEKDVVLLGAASSVSSCVPMRMRSPMSSTAIDAVIMYSHD